MESSLGPMFGNCSRRIAAAMLTLAILFSMENKAMSEPSCASQEALTRAASKVGLVFPKGAHLMGTRGESGIDELVQIKVETDRAGFEDFIRANRIDRSGFEEVQRVLLLPDADWWDPSKAPSLPTIQIRREGGPTLNIGYAFTSAGPIDLYIMWFTN